MVKLRKRKTAYSTKQCSNQSIQAATNKCTNKTLNHFQCFCLKERFAKIRNMSDIFKECS